MHINILNNKPEKKKGTPIPSGKQSNRISREQISRTGSRNQDKIDERTRTPVAYNEQQLQIRNVFLEKAYINVSFI